MINKLRLLGKYVHEIEGDKNPLNLNLTLETANVIILDFVLNNGFCEYKGFDTIEFDQSKNHFA